MITIIILALMQAQANASTKTTTVYMTGSSHIMSKLDAVITLAKDPSVKVYKCQEVELDIKKATLRVKK